MAANNKSFVKTIKIPIYGALLTVHIGPTNSLRDSLKKQGIKVGYELENELNVDSVGGTCALSNGHIVVFVHTDDKRYIHHHAVLIHELFHATCHILHKRGVKLTDDSEEAFAYLLSYITEQVMGNEPTRAANKRRRV